MNDNLPKVEADTIELIGGGAVFVMCLSYLLWALGYRLPDEITLSRVAMFSTPLALLGVTFAYVFGVMVESLSRVVFEWDLNRITVRHKSFHNGGSVPGLKPSGESGDTGPEQGQAATTEGAGGSRVGTLAGLRSIYLGPGFDDHDLQEAIMNREAQRSTISETLDTTAVDSQLKRLRLERMLCLSAAVLTIGFSIHGIGGDDLAWVLVGLAATGVTFGLVHIRFRRYCDAVARMYLLIAERKIPV